MSLFEGTNVNLKGWIHGRKRKLILWKPKSHIRPYHTEHVANNPKSYGMTEHDLLKIIAKGMPLGATVSPNKINCDRSLILAACRCSLY